jgi:hypothetical protein
MKKHADKQVRMRKEGVILSPKGNIRIASWLVNHWMGKVPWLVDQYSRLLKAK